METFIENVNKLIGTDMQLDLMKLLGVNLHEVMQKNISEEVRTAVANLLGSGVEGNWFYYIAPVCLLLLLIFWKKRRITFAIPVLIIMLLVMNPFAKEKFEKITETGYYWRLLWIIPIIPICAALPGMIEEKIRFQYTKGIFAIIFAGLFVLMGSYTYDQRLARFFTPANESKIEQPFVDIADVLLTYDDHPYVVADAWPSVFIRQYTSKVRLLYGRDILGYGIPSELGNRVYSHLCNGQYTDMASAMLDNGYQYLVTNNSDEGKRDELREAGFLFLTQVDEYGIYKIHGIPLVKKERNELGQIISVTCLNKYGLPTNGENGYATISYTYDNNGHIIRVFHTDLDGNGVADELGVAGYEREYDSRDRLIMEKNLDIYGRLVLNSAGYASYRNEYNGKGELMLTYFYDPDGNVVQMGSGILHQYLQSLLGRNLLVFISAKDEASDNLTGKLVEDMHKLGLQANLRDKYRYSYLAVVSPDGIVEELSPEKLQHEGNIGSVSYQIKSAGLYAGNYSSIIINGLEYSKNRRGLNIVVVENGNVIDSIAFDTNSRLMNVY